MHTRAYACAVFAAVRRCRSICFPFICWCVVLRHSASSKNVGRLSVYECVRAVRLECCRFQSIHNLSSATETNFHSPYTSYMHTTCSIFFRVEIQLMATHSSNINQNEKPNVDDIQHAYKRRRANVPSSEKRNTHTQHTYEIVSELSTVRSTWHHHCDADGDNELRRREEEKERLRETDAPYRTTKIHWQTTNVLAGSRIQWANAHS